MSKSRSLRVVTVILPALSFSSPLMQRISVDLPEPDEPRIDTTSPGFTVRFTPSRTVTGRPLQTQEAWREQVHAGLVGLGWSTRDAEDAVTAVSPLAADSPNPSVPDLLRAALRVLSKA